MCFDNHVILRLLFLYLQEPPKLEDDYFFYDLETEQIYPIQL